MTNNNLSYDELQSIFDMILKILADLRVGNSFVPSDKPNFTQPLINKGISAYQLNRVCKCVSRILQDECNTVPSASLAGGQAEASESLGTVLHSSCNIREAHLQTRFS